MSEFRWTFPLTETQPKPTSHKWPSSSVYPVNPWTAESDQDIWQTYSCVVVLSLQGVDSSAANLELGWRVRKSTCFPFCRRQARERGYQLHAAGFFCCALVVALTLWHSNMSFLLFTTVCSANTSTGQFFRKLAKSPSASAAPGIFGTGWILYSGAGPCPCGRIMHLGSIFRQWLMLS